MDEPAAPHPSHSSRSSIGRGGADSSPSFLSTLCSQFTVARRFIVNKDVPQHLSILTLGAFDLSVLRAFYRTWGWSELDASSDEWCAFDVGGCLLSIYPLELLGDEAAPGEPVLAAPWRGFTMAINVETEDDVQAVFDTAVASGAIEIQVPTRRDWGGLSAYIADPEGNRWEIAAGGPSAAPTAS